MDQGHREQFAGTFLRVERCREGFSFMHIAFARMMAFAVVAPIYLYVASSIVTRKNSPSDSNRSVPKYHPARIRDGIV